MPDLMPVDYDPFAPQGVLAKQVAGFPQRAADLAISALGPLGEAGVTVGDMLRTGQVDPRDIPQVAGGIMLGTMAPQAEEANAASTAIRRLAYLPLDKLRAPQGIANQGFVDRLTQKILSGDELYGMPPIRVVKELPEYAKQYGTDWRVSDGTHRVAAAQAAGKTHVLAELGYGDKIPDYAFPLDDNIQSLYPFQPASIALQSVEHDPFAQQ
jgi:hypothetical protein